MRGKAAQAMGKDGILAYIAVHEAQLEAKWSNKLKAKMATACAGAEKKRDMKAAILKLAEE